MKTERCFINGVGVISPQPTFDNTLFLANVVDYTTNLLSCFTPEFKNLINPIQLRRMSRMQKIGLTAALICMNDSGIESPDGIITATGNGSSNSKSIFVEEYLSQQEAHIAPTHFVQSSYNSIAGLVAMSFRCMGYNNSYSSSGFAFETALQDALLQLADQPSLNFLVGSYDESSEVLFELNNKTGHFKKDIGSSLELFERKTPGTLEGEGAAFFLLSSKLGAKAWCAISEPKMLYKPNNADEILHSLTEFLQESEVDMDSIDLLISGASGDQNTDALINQIVETNFAKTAQGRFKHLCGDYYTSTSFAVWLGASILKANSVPISVRANEVPCPPVIKRILLANHYRNRNYSFILMEKAIT